MAEANNQRNVYNANDTLDINELASLNDDITPEFIEQLQNQVSQNANKLNGVGENLPISDGELFEEININSNSDENNESQEEKSPIPPMEDEFAKKYKAKLNQQNSPATEVKAEPEIQEVHEEPSPTESTNDTISEKQENTVDATVKQNSSEIHTLTSGNIVEKPATQEQLNYNQSLDFQDGDTKYSKYVIYIDPQNKEFIESLTVKERKNLINRILREQDDIAITKRRLGLVQTIIKHAVVVIVTIALAIPIIYWTINASLEASINNYRRSQTIFKTLYKEKGKIKSQKKH